MPSVTLSLSTLDEVKSLVEKELIDIDFTESDIEKLAETLEYFPFKIQRAITYIKQQHIKQCISGGNYGVQDYLDKIEKEKSKLS